MLIIIIVIIIIILDEKISSFEECMDNKLGVCAS